MRAQNELLDAIQVLIDKSLKDKATKVTGGKVKSASGGRAIITINGYDYPIPYSGDAPKVGSTVRVFIPNGNMSDAFIGGGGGGGSTGTTNYNNLTNKPRINGVTLSGNKTSTELGVYGTGNEPPYPVTSVNGQTGDVTIEATGGVTSVNGKSGDVTLTASDVGALPSTTKIPSATSDLTNDSGYITAAGAPVQSVDGQTGEVVTNAVKTTAQTLTNAQKAQARTNIGAGTSSFSGAYDDLTGKPTIPSKTSDLDNDSGFITNAALAPYAKTADVPTKTSQLNNDSGFVDAAGASAAAPVQSVNAKTGAVVLTQDDVGNGTTYVRTHNDFTDAAKQQINTNKDNIATLDSDMEAAQGDITTLKGNVTTLTTALQSKQDKIAGGASTITDDNLVANRALVSNGSGKVAVSAVTATELGYLDGVTSNVQTQLNKKLESAPVTSVNAKTGAVVLGASDVGAVSTANVTQTLGTSTTKVPSEKAVSDAIGAAGGGDMLKSTYDPDGSVATAGGIPNYVEANGGKIDTIKVNGVAQSIANKEVDITVPTNNNQLANGAGYITLSDVPVKSVNGKTGEVELVASDIGALAAPAAMTANRWFKTDAGGNVVLSALPNASTGARGITYLVNSYTRTDTDKAVTPKALNDVYKLIPEVTQTLGSSTTKVPSEKAVADALSGAGAGDMLKATYDPTGSVETAGGIPDYVAGQLPTVNNATLTIQKNGKAVGTFTANASANKSINITMAKGDVGLSNVDNVKQYSVDNPPPYPVTSVAGKTGDVTLTKSNVGLGNVDNVKQYSASNPPPYPVTSVNGQTGAVEIDVGGGGTTIVLSSSQPSGLKAGDYWYQIVT